MDATEQWGSVSGEPLRGDLSCQVTDCVLWHPMVTPGAGYWFDTPDPDSYTGVSPVFVVRSRIAVVATSELILDRFCKVLQPFCSVTKIILSGETPSKIVVSSIDTLLQNFAIDVVIVALSCTMMLVDMKLPSDWLEAGIALKEVIIEAKPLESRELIRTKSWLVRQLSW